MGMGSHEYFQLPDQLAVAAGGEPHLGVELHRRQPQLLQPGRLRLRPRLVGELRQGGTAPQRQRLIQQPGRVGRVPRRRPSRLGDEPVEPGRVDLLVVQLEQVAGRPGDQHAHHRPECAAQRRDPALQGIGRAAWRLVAPEVVDQPVGGHDPPGVHQ
jgi:hypothetical protein